MQTKEEILKILKEEAALGIVDSNTGYAILGENFANVVNRISERYASGRGGREWVSCRNGLPEDWKMKHMRYADAERTKLDTDLFEEDGKFLKKIGGEGRVSIELVEWLDELAIERCASLCDGAKIYIETPMSELPTKEGTYILVGARHFIPVAVWFKEGKWSNDFTGNKKYENAMGHTHWLRESGDSSTSQPAQGEDNAAYWKHRCKLAECVIEATPCDPDITSRQIKANDEYRKFLAGAPIPQDVIRADGAAELLAPQPIETLPAQGVEEAAEAHKLIDQFIEERVEYIQEWAGREYELLRKVADFVISQFAGASYQSSNGDKELQELRAWKREAISVMPDYQAIGKAIGVQPGETVHDKILPFIERLSKGTVDRGANCPACNITKHGVKTRIAPVHTCGRK